MRPLISLILLCGIAAGSSFAREIEEPEIEANRHYRIQVDAARSMASALRATVRNVGQLGAQLIESRGMAEIAGAIEPGREVQVYVLHKIMAGAEEDSDLTLEVSPHPYPPFLSAPDIAYRVERKYVVGTGTFLALGMPPYPGARDLAGPSQTTIGPRPDVYESSRQRAQWSLYRITADLWKEQYAAPLPLVEAQVRDLDGHITLMRTPTADVMADLRRQLGELEKQIVELEESVQGQINTFEPIRSQDPGILRLKRDQQAVKASLPALRVAMESVAGIGGSQAIGRENAGFYRVLQALSMQLNLRTVAYQRQIDQEREAARARQLEEDKRMRAIRRLGWDYLASVVGAACADPARAAEMDREGRIAGIELSSTDFTFFFVDDVVTRNDLVGILRGESQPKLNTCQQAVLDDMLRKKRTIGMADIVARVQRWRADNPTLPERIDRAGDALNKRVAAAFDRMAKSFEDLFSAMAQATRDIGIAWNSSGSSSSGSRGGGGRERESSGYSGGGRSGPTVDLRRPDFGPGSTLGR